MNTPTLYNQLFGGLSVALGNLDQATFPGRVALRAASEDCLIDPQLHALVSLTAIRKVQRDDSAAQIVATVERHPASPPTVRNRVQQSMPALTDDSLAPGNGQRKWISTSG